MSVENLLVKAPSAVIPWETSQVEHVASFSEGVNANSQGRLSFG